MGRVRTNLIKKAAKVIIERFFSRLTLDFDTNKKIVDEVCKLPSKRVRNKIAGFTTHLMKRIQRGPVRGISLKLQEEQREKRMDFVPDRSALDIEKPIDIDEDTLNLLRSLKFGNMNGLTVSSTPELLLRPARTQNRPQQTRKKRDGPREGGGRDGGDSGNRDNRNTRRSRKADVTASAPEEQVQADASS